MMQEETESAVPGTSGFRDNMIAAMESLKQFLEANSEYIKSLQDTLNLQNIVIDDLKKQLEEAIVKAGTC